MKIGIDCSSVISQKTGIGSFASYLVETLLSISNGVQFNLYRPEGGIDLNAPRRIWWESVGLRRRATHDDVAALYSPGFSPPPYGKFKKIVTVHDLIGLIYPKNVGPASRFYWSVWLPGNLKKADRLVASSESTRRDIKRFLGIPESRVEVVPLAVRPHFRILNDEGKVNAVLEKYKLRRPFFICVSTLEPRKNLLRLLRAFETAQKKHKEISLVLVGKPGGAEGELTKFIQEKNLMGCVKMLGYVPDDDLAALYNGAIAYAALSLYEGFGLPALEAMACGLTGIVSNRSSLPEVTGNTARLVDPENVDEIVEGLAWLIRADRERSELASAAYVRSKDFSIEKTALAMMEIFKKEANNENS